MHEALRARYAQAVERFVENIKKDKQVLAVILCGSVAYDRVWPKSDVDITVLVRDQHLTAHEYAIEEDGIVINVEITTRTQFQRTLNRANGASFVSSLYALGRIVYTTDDTLQELLDEAKTIGTADIGRCLLWMCCDLIFYLQKIEKWLTVKHDPMYAKLYILKAAETVAVMEMAVHGEPPIREALMRAEQLNPALINTVYRTPMRNDLNAQQVKAVLQQMYAYLDKHLPTAAQSVTEFMADGEPRTVTVLVNYFKIGSHGLIKLMEYLAEQGILQKLSQTIRITPKGRPVAEEMAYMYRPG